MHRYPELMIAPMRAEMTALGAEELRTADAVDRFMEDASGTTLLVINSVCGCSGGTMRPGLRAAFERVRPDRLGTVFAGADLEATERARELFHPYPPSSPFIGVFREGVLVAALERSDIKGHEPADVEAGLVRAMEAPAG